MPPLPPQERTKPMPPTPTPRNLHEGAKPMPRLLIQDVAGRVKRTPLLSFLKRAKLTPLLQLQEGPSSRSPSRARRDQPTLFFLFNERAKPMLRLLLKEEIKPTSRLLLHEGA